jgi:hypothetical protein
MRFGPNQIQYCIYSALTASVWVSTQEVYSSQHRVYSSQHKKFTALNTGSLQLSTQSVQLSTQEVYSSQHRKFTALNTECVQLSTPEVHNSQYRKCTDKETRRYSYATRNTLVTWKKLAIAMYTHTYICMLMFLAHSVKTLMILCIVVTSHYLKMLACVLPFVTWHHCLTSLEGRAVRWQQPHTTQLEHKVYVLGTVPEGFPSNDLRCMGTSVIGHLNTPTFSLIWQHLK